MANNRVVVNFDFKANTQDVKQQLNNLQRELLQLSTSINTTGMTGKMAQGLREASQAAIQLKGHLANAVNPVTGGLDLTKLNTSLTSAGQSLTQFSAKLLQGGTQGQAAFQQLATTIMSVQGPLLQSNVMLDKMWATLKNTARWQISSAILTGFISSISEGVSYAKELNKTLTDIRIVTGQSKDQMDELAKSANKMAKELKSTTTEITKAQLIYYQQGDNAALAAKKAEITTKAANVSFNTSSQQMSEYLTAIWNSYQVGEHEMERFADVLAAIGATTATSMEEIATAMQKVAATGNTVGVSYEQLSATIATISSATRTSAEQVGTALKTIYARIGDLKLGKTDEDNIGLGQVSSQLLSAGIHIADTEGNLRDLGEVVEEIGGKWSDWTKAQQVAVVQAIAGKRQYTQMMALFDNWDKYEANVLTANTAEGELNKQYEIWAEGWEAASQRVKQSAGEVYQKIFDDDIFIDMTNVLADFIGIFDELINMSGGFGTVLLGLGAILTRVFSSQLANGLQTLGYNFRVLFTDSTKTAQSMRDQITTQLMASEGFQSLSSSTQNYILSLKDISSAQELFEQHSKNLTNESRALAQAQIEVIQQLKTEGQTALDTAEDYKTLAMQMTKRGSTSEKKNAVQEGTRIAQNQNAIENKLQQIGNMTFIPKGKTNTDVATTDINKMNAALDLAKLRFGENSTKVKVLEAALKRGSMSFKEIKIATGGARKEIAAGDGAIAQLAQNLGITTPTGIQKFITIIKAAAGEMDIFDDKTEAAEQELLRFKQQMENSKYYSNFSQSIVTLSSALMGLSTIITSLSSAINVFKDENASAWEKTQAIIGIVTSLGFALISIIPAITAYRNSLKVLQTEQLKTAATASQMWGAILWPVALVVLTIGGVVALIADMTHTSGKELDEAQKKAEEARQKFEETNKTLEETNNKIDELLNKDKLTLVEEQELLKLKAEQAALERNVELLKEKAELENQEANEKALSYAQDYDAKNYLGDNVSKDATGNLKYNVTLFDDEGNTTNEKLTKDEIIARIEEIEKREANGTFKAMDSNNVTALENARNALTTSEENLSENTQHIIDDLMALEERASKVIGLDETASRARRELRKDEYELAKQLYGEDSEQFQQFQAEKMDALLTLYSESDEELSDLLTDKIKKEEEITKGTASTQDYTTQYDNINQYLAYLEQAKTQGIITIEEYDAAVANASNEIGNNVAMISTEIYNMLGEDGKDLFKGTLDAMVGLENAMASGKISSAEYAQALNDNLSNLDFESVFEGNEKALQKFTAQMGGKIANLLSNTTEKFNRGKISISEYGKEMIEALKAQKILLEQNGENIDDISKKIEEAENKWKSYSGITDFIEGALSEISSFGEMSSNELDTYYSGLLNKIQNSNAEFQAEFLKNLKETTGKTFDSVKDVSAAIATNQVNAQQVTQAALDTAKGNIKTLSESTGEALTALGTLIGNFDYTIGFSPKIKGSSIIPFKIGKKEEGGLEWSIDLPEVDFGIKGKAGDGMTDAFNSFSTAITNIAGHFDGDDVSDDRFDVENLFGNKFDDDDDENTGGKTIEEEDKNTGSKGKKDPAWKIEYEKRLEQIEYEAERDGLTKLELGRKLRELYNEYYGHMFEIEDEETGKTYEKYFFDKAKDVISNLKNGLTEAFDDELANAKRTGVYDYAKLSTLLSDTLKQAAIEGVTFSEEEKNELIDTYVSEVQGLMSEASSDLDTKFENQEFFSGIINLDEKMAGYNDLLKTAQDYLKELENNGATTKQLAEYENSVVIPLIKKKRDLLKEEADAAKEATEHYIKMREFYGYKNGDNEIKARERSYKRMLNLTQEQILAEYGTYQEYWYALEEERLNIDQIFRDKLKEALEKEKDDRIAILEAEKNAAEKLYEGENTLREKRKQINDQLQESLTMYQYLDKATRKLIFNEEDYLALSNTLNEIEEDMYDLNQKYLRDIVGKEADELEYINAEYERQNELLMNRYEIAEKELGVIKARAELENTLKERNTQMFINGRWQWVADQKAVIEAQKKLNDAEFDKETSELENEQEFLINSFEKQIDNANQAWEKATKVLEDKVMTVAELMSSLSEPMDDLTAKFYELATGKKITSRGEQKSIEDANSKLAKDTALAIIRKKEEYDVAKAQGDMTKAQEIEEQAKASYQILQDLGYNELAEELHKSDLATAKKLNLDKLTATKQQTDEVVKQIENTENAVVEAIESIDISSEKEEEEKGGTGEPVDLKQDEKVSQIVNDIAWYKQAWEEGDEATRKEAEQNAKLLYDELKQLGRIELAQELANSTYKESVEILNQINENIKKSNSSSSSGGGGSSRSSMSGIGSSGGSGKSTISSSYTTPDGVSVQIGTNSNGDTVVYNNEGGHWHTVGIVPKVKGGKARGSRSVIKGFYEINEIGEETYVTPDGHFRNFAGGEVVFTHEQSQRLFSLLNADLFNINKMPRVGEFEQSNSNDTYISIGGISIDTTTQDGKDLVEILQRITNI